MQNSFREIANVDQLELKASNTCVNSLTCPPVTARAAPKLPKGVAWRAIEGSQAAGREQDNQSCSVAPDSNLNAKCMREALINLHEWRDF